MINDTESLLKKQIKVMAGNMTEMLLERLNVSEDFDPKDVTKDFSEKLSTVIGDYVLNSFKDYDGNLSDSLQDILKDNEVSAFLQKYFSSAFEIRSGEVFFKKSIYSLMENHIFQRIDSSTQVASATDIGSTDSMKVMDSLSPKKVQFLPDDQYPDRPLTENRLMDSDFTAAGIYTVSDEEKVFGDIKNFIPVIIAALKRVNAIVKEYDNIIGIIRNNDYGEAKEETPAEGTILYKIKRLESKIGDEATEGTLMYRLKNIETQLSSLDSSVSSLSSNVSSLSSSINSLEGRVSALESSSSSGTEGGE